LGEVLLIGLGGDAEDEVTDLELGRAEQRSRAAADEGPRDLKKLLVTGLGNSGGQLLGLSFLFGTERFLHD
jgi:hypothetical protein